MAHIGFIGASGLMGHGMARHLLGHGHALQLTVHELQLNEPPPPAATFFVHASGGVGAKFAVA